MHAPFCAAAGQAPLFKQMEEEFERRAAQESAERQQHYSEAVGAYKMARVAQLVRAGAWRKTSAQGCARRARSYAIGGVGQMLQRCVIG